VFEAQRINPVSNFTGYSTAVESSCNFIAFKVLG
jgi:hypothetical protein